MKQVGRILFVCMLLVLLPGCGRLIDYAKSNFYQGETVPFDSKLIQRYIRSVRVYDQLVTSAIFDAMWLSDEIRTAYADLYATRRGKDEEHKKAFLRRQLEENNHFITFFVLSLYEVPLGDPESEWSLFITVDGNNYMPIEIKMFDLPHEYIVFFGARYTRFKTAYRIKFDARNVEEKLILTPETKKLTLHFRSANSDVPLEWYFGSNGLVTKERKYYGVDAGEKTTENVVASEEVI